MNETYPPLPPMQTGIRGRCPRCGQGHLFKGFLTLAPQCEACGLDYSFADPADGPAFFVICFACVPSVALAVWLVRSQRRLVALAVGGILGGALGNLVDRVAYGAVVDFVHLHYAGYSWYVFNIADAAIVVGVVLLLLDGFLSPRTRQTEA